MQTRTSGDTRFGTGSKPAKPRLKRAAQKAERTRLLLEAAWVIYRGKGYEAATIDDIAAYAGVSRMPVYSLFGDKQNLYFELWCSFVDQMLIAMLGALKPGAGLRRNLQVLAGIVAAAEGETGNPAPEGLFFVVQTIALSRPEIAAKLRDKANAVIGGFAAMIAASRLEPGEALRGSAERVAAHLVAHINGLSTVALQTRGRHGRNRARELGEVFHAIAFRSRHA